MGTEYHKDGQAKPPKTFSIADLLIEELPPTKWIVPDILPEGVTLLVGKPKIGKTWLAQGLSVAVATGGMALGAKPVERGRVLYLALEDNRRRLHKRFRKLVTQSVPDGLEAALEWPRLTEGGAECIDRWLTARPDARLIVIDTLKKVRSRETGRGIYDIDYEALEPLVPVAAEHGVSILVVHHQRKLEAADPLDTISGSTGLTGGVDGALVLRRDRGKADAYLFVEGRDIEEAAEYALRWDAPLASWQLLGDAEAYRLGETRAKIHAALPHEPEWMSPKDVAEATGENLDNVKQTLKRMAEVGQVKKLGHGKYCHFSHSVTFDGSTPPDSDKVTGVTPNVQDSVNGETKSSFSGKRDSQHRLAPLAGSEEKEGSVVELKRDNLSSSPAKPPSGGPSGAAHGTLRQPENNDVEEAHANNNWRLRDDEVELYKQLRTIMRPEAARVEILRRREFGGAA